MVKTIFSPNNKCVFCGREIKSQIIVEEQNKLNFLCSNCQNQIEQITGKICARCGHPGDYPHNLCSNCCEISPNYLTMNRSYALYTGIMVEQIYLWKYRGKQSLTSYFGQMLFLTWKRYYQDMEFDYLTYVPLHRIRLSERGFNQALSLAEELSNLTKIPLISSLERNILRPKQSKQGKNKRKEQVKNTFQIINEEMLKDKKLLLIDDIYTTGSTLEECSRVLLNNGVKEVIALTLCRGKYEERVNVK